MKLEKTLAAAVSITLMLTTTLAGCVMASASEQSARKPATEFTWVSDYYYQSPDPQGATRILAEIEAREAEKASDAEIAAAMENEAIYYEPTYYEPSQSVVRGNPDGLNSFDGVYEYGGRTETFYSTHAVYDSQLTVDEQGFWRDDQGRYVVASSDYGEGTEIEISQGKAVVMDSGPESGVVDVHTAW